MDVVVIPKTGVVEIIKMKAKSQFHEVEEAIEEAKELERLQTENTKLRKHFEAMAARNAELEEALERANAPISIKSPLERKHGP